MKTLILNQHSSNFGDDAAGSALVQILLEHGVSSIDIIYNAEKTIPCFNAKVHHHPEIKFSTAGYLNVLLYLLFAPLGFKGTSEQMQKWGHIIRNADTIFVAPSGANIGIYKDWRFLVRLLMAVRAGKKLIFHYNTIGPSGNIVFDYIAKKILKKSNIYVREQKSLLYIQSLGLHGVWGPDTAFALQPLNSQIETDLISFVPSSFDNWHPNFKSSSIDDKIINELIPEIGKWVRDNNCRIQILPHLCTKEETIYNARICAVLTKCGVSNVCCRNDVDSVWKYDEELAKSRLVIGMRYHAIVLSAKNYRPFVSLSYENKMNEVCSYLHQCRFDCNLVRYVKGESLCISEVLSDAYIHSEEISSNLKKTLKNEIIPKVQVPVINHILKERDCI